MLPVRVRLSAYCEYNLMVKCYLAKIGFPVQVRIFAPCAVVGKVMASGNPVYSKQVVDSSGS